MIKQGEKLKFDEMELLKRFNNRDSIAFGEVYTLYHNELSIYTASLYREMNVMSEDVIQDVFVNLWLSTVKFEMLINVKAYIYVSIKNSFRNYLRNNSYAEKYSEQVKLDHDFEVDVMESEMYSFVDELTNILPKSYAEVIDLYLKGWKSGEIAEKLIKTEQNIYNIKTRAITVLRKKLDKDKLFIVNILLGGI